MQEAYTSALKYDPATAYEGSTSRGIRSGVSEASRAFATGLGTMTSVLGIPLRSFEEDLGFHSPSTQVGWHNLAMNAHNRTLPPGAPDPSYVPSKAAYAPGLEQYVPLVNKIAGEEGVEPAQLLAIMSQEDPKGIADILGPMTRSGEQAVGLGQIMPYTAASMGVDPATLTDPEVNIRTMARLHRTNLDRRGGSFEEALKDYYGRGTPLSGTGPTTEDYARQVMSRYTPGIGKPAAEAPKAPPSYSYESNEPKSWIGKALKYGSDEPILGGLSKWFNEEANYYSFWHSVNPDRNWKEKATAFVVDQTLQLPLYMAAGAAAKLGIGGIAASQGVATVAPNLTKVLNATGGLGKLATHLLTNGTEGLIYGGLTEPLDNKADAWKDAAQFAVMGTLFSWWGKGEAGGPGTALTLMDHLPKEDPTRALMMKEFERSNLGAQGKRLATWEEILGQHRQHIANVAAASGRPGVATMLEEALGHARTAEMPGYTDEAWTNFKKERIAVDPTRYKGTFAMTEMIRGWLARNGTSLKAIDEALAKGDRSGADDLVGFLHGQTKQALEEFGIHVPDANEAGARGAADAYTKSKEGQAEIQKLIQSGAPPAKAIQLVKDRVAKNQTGMIQRSEEIKTQTGPVNVARTTPNTPGDGQSPLAKGGVEPRFTRKGRYTYDKGGQVVGYSLSTGFDWKVAMSNAARDRGWKGKGSPAKDNAFWKAFANFHDDAHTDNPEGFINDLKQYFNPLKDYNLHFEKAGTSDHTNFLAFMYHFRDELPKPIQDKLQEVLLNSKKMASILNTRRVTEDQLNYFSQAMANHVEMFTRSKWFLEKHEKNIFRSTQPDAGISTIWQRDLLENMQKRELAEASKLFPGRSKAALAARDAYRTALTIMHADETAAFNANNFPKDKGAAPRLGAAMGSARKLITTAKAGKLDDFAVTKLVREHKDLMNRIGSSGRIGPEGMAREAEVLYKAEHPTFDPMEKIQLKRKGDKLEDEFNDVTKKAAQLSDAHDKAVLRHGDQSPEAEAAYKEFENHIKGTYTPKREELRDFMHTHLGGKWPHDVQVTPKTMVKVGKSKVGATGWVANEPMQNLRKALKGTKTPRGMSLGFSMEKRHVPYLHQELQKYAYDYPFVNTLHSFIDALDKATPAGKSLQFVNFQQELRDVIDTYAEEWTHSSQTDIGGGNMLKHLTDSQYDDSFNEMPLGMLKYLQTHYRGKSPKEWVHEAAAKLLTQKASKFGITEAQQTNYLWNYLNRIVATNGRDALQHFKAARGVGRKMVESFR